jgi:hypothetical protein
MLNAPQLSRPSRRLFDDDFQRLRAKLVKPTGYLKELYDLMVVHSTIDREATGTRVAYVPSAVMLGLLDGSKEAIAQARKDFLVEWQDGHSLSRDPKNPIHYWNSPTFKTNDRWISAAILVQLLILWDWLAEAGAWSEAEIEAHAESALGVLESFIEPHLKGRGHMPILHDPINQGAAMSAGLLYGGYLFGTKWRQDARAVRMYGRGRNLLADHIGQYMTSGYDGDGFTYLRYIHLQCFTLGVALLEDVEGGDWYHREFAPHQISLAWLNERQFDFIGPSGCSWPLGRYGYVKTWNVFNLAYASKRTGDARYLQTSKRDNENYRFDSPWLRMEIPLALLWYPETLNDTITRQPLAIHPIQECLPDSWATFYEPESRMQALSVWMRGKVPHFVLEAGGSPLLPGGGNAWSDANGVQPGEFDYDLQGWMLPAGKLIRHGFLPACGAAATETTPAYPPKAEVSFSSRAVLHLPPGLMVISDRFETTRAQAPFWQGRVLKGSSAVGGVVTLAGREGVTGRLASADGDLSIVPSGLKRLEHEVLGWLETDFLRIAGRPGKSAFDVVVSWDPARTPSIKREREDLLSFQEGDKSFSILLPAREPSGLRRIGAYETDAAMAVLEGSGRLALFGVRVLRDASGERAWSDVPLNLEIDPEGLAIEDLGYGNFLSYRAQNTFVGIKRGNGLEIYARTPRNFSVRVRGKIVGAVINDVPVDDRELEGWTRVEVPAWKSPAGDLLAELRAAVSADSDTLIPLLNRIRAAMLQEAIPEVRELLTWDGSKILHAGEHRVTESSHVRMEVARTLAVLGDAGAIDPLIALVERELATVYNPTSKWGAQFVGSSARVVAIEALIFLHAAKFVPVIDRIKPEEGVPHVQDILIRAREILSDAR